MKVTIGPAGEIGFIYNDDARALLDAGVATIRRASHVEPQGTRWTADMGPVGGPVLGPFETRQAALAAEVSWLDAHLSTVN